MSRIGFIVALPDELKTLTKERLPKGSWKHRKEGGMVALSGAGPDYAERAARMLADNGAELLISWGCAAALDPRLAPGDILLADEILAACGECLPVPPTLRRAFFERLAGSLPVRGGRLVESEQPVSDSAAKRKLAMTSQGAAVDMESASVCRVAQACNKPFLAIRAIADPAGMDLPQAVVHALDNGEIMLSRLFRHLLRHPMEVAALIRLGGQFRTAQKNLYRAAALIEDALGTPFELEQRAGDSLA